MKRSKFISFEGIEGCGKSTQAKLLQQFLIKKQQPVLLTREPGGTKTGELLRQVLFDETLNLEATTELLLNFAARFEHVTKVIKPALANQEWVISDRFFDSSYAYQGAAMGLGSEMVIKIKEICLADFAPDLTFLIDLPVETAFERINGRKSNNRYEKLGFEFHQKIRDCYLELSRSNPRIKVISGNQKIEEISAQILDIAISNFSLTSF